MYILNKQNTYINISFVWFLSVTTVTLFTSINFFAKDLNLICLMNGINYKKILFY